jgi:hypothetical protein
MRSAAWSRTIVLLALLPCGAHAASAPGAPPVPSKLLALIQSTIPGAEVVRPEDIDSKSCQPVGSSPSIVHSDLTGNHRDDFALLLKTKDTGKQTIWQGKNLKEAQFALMLFRDDGRGGYVARRLKTFTDFVPLAAYIDLEPAGKVHNAFTNRDVATDHPAVSLVFCEKSEAVYYIQGDKVSVVPVSD